MNHKIARKIAFSWNVGKLQYLIIIKQYSCIYLCVKYICGRRQVNGVDDEDCYKMESNIIA